MLIENLSLNQTLDILALCETYLDDSIDSGNFSVSSYLPLIRKDSGTHMHGLTVYAKEGLPLFFKKIGFTLCKAEQPLRGMELQEKEAQKD